MNEFIFFIKGFFGAPAILIGIFALIGSLLQRKKFTDVMVSTLKAAGGYLILIGGIGILNTPLTSFTAAFSKLFGLEGVMGNSDALAGGIMKAVPNIATVAALMMFIAIILNVSLARISRFKYIFLTGHHTLYICVILSSIFHFAGMDIIGGDMWYALIIGSMIMALYMLLSPLFSKSAMETINQDNKLYIGHANAMGFGIATGIGALVGKISKGKVKSTEGIKFPKWLNVFSNSVVAVFVTMLIIFGITYGAFWGVKGKDAFVALENGGLLDTDSVIVKIIIDALTFTAGVEVLIFGIKTMLAELMPALEGISERWIPKAKMAVDCSVAMYYMPTAVLIGFIFSFLGGIIGLLISIGLHAAAPTTFGAIVIPGIIAHFFCGGVSGTFANVKGGIIGAMLAGFINGLILTIIPLVFIAMQGVYGWEWSMGEAANKSLQWAESDYLIFSIFGWLLKIGWTKWLVMALVFGAVGALVIDGYFWNKKDRKNNPEFYAELKKKQIAKKEEAIVAKKAKKMKEQIQQESTIIQEKEQEVNSGG